MRLPQLVGNFAAILPTLFDRGVQCSDVCSGSLSLRSLGGVCGSLKVQLQGVDLARRLLTFGEQRGLESSQISLCGTMRLSHFAVCHFQLTRHSCLLLVGLCQLGSMRLLNGQQL